MRKVADHRFADDVLFLYKRVLPVTGVPGIVAVVTHHKITAFRHLEGTEIFLKYLAGVVLAERGAIDVDYAVNALYRLPRQPHNAL